MQGIKREQADQFAEREALTEQLEHEVLATHVEIATVTVEFIRKHGIPGQRVDVFTASGDDLIGEHVLDAIYDRLGIRGARADAIGEGLLADSGESLGTEYQVLASYDLVISELQVDERMQVGSYRTLQVQRPRA